MLFLLLVFRIGMALPYYMKIMSVKTSMGCIDRNFWQHIRNYIFGFLKGDGTKNLARRNFWNHENILVEPINSTDKTEDNVFHVHDNIESHCITSGIMLKLILTTFSTLGWLLCRVQIP
jgi:hypothetical protein